AHDPRDELWLGALVSQEPDVPRDERDLLGEPVVHVAREPTPFLERGGCDDARPVRGDLARGANQESEVEAEAEDVAGVDPVRVDRRMEVVVDATRTGEDARDREPAAELVSGETAPPREAERR